jgi:hypothetical protein
VARCERPSDGAGALRTVLVLSLARTNDLEFREPCVWLNGQRGTERGGHSFSHVWMRVKQGRVEPQTIFRWRRRPQKTSG